MFWARVWRKAHRPIRLLVALNARLGMEVDVQPRKWQVSDWVYIVIYGPDHCIYIWLLYLQIDEAADRYSFMAKMLGASWIE